MRGVSIKLPDATLQQLKREARATGRSVAALMRARVESHVERSPRSVYGATSDLAGSLAGGRTPATNTRRRFGR